MRDLMRGMAVGAGLFLVMFTPAFAEPTEQFCAAKHEVVWAKALEGASAYGLHAAKMDPSIAKPFLVEMRKYASEPFPTQFSELWIVVNPDSQQVMLAFVGADGCTVGNHAIGPFKLDDAVSALSKVGK